MIFGTVKNSSQVTVLLGKNSSADTKLFSRRPKGDSYHDKRTVVHVIPQWQFHKGSGGPEVNGGSRRSRVSKRGFDVRVDVKAVSECRQRRLALRSQVFFRRAPVEIGYTLSHWTEVSGSGGGTGLL